MCLCAAFVILCGRWKKERRSERERDYLRMNRTYKNTIKQAKALSVAQPILITYKSHAYAHTLALFLALSFSPFLSLHLSCSGRPSSCLHTETDDAEKSKPRNKHHLVSICHIFGCEQKTESLRHKGIRPINFVLKMFHFWIVASLFASMLETNSFHSSATKETAMTMTTYILFPVCCVKLL